MGERPRSISEEDLTRLKREREEADRRYNDALTALDTAIQKLPEFPHPPPPPDDAQVTPLNTRWEVLTAKPALPSGIRGRLARFVWGLVEPVVTSQAAGALMPFWPGSPHLEPSAKFGSFDATSIWTVRSGSTKLTPS